MSINTSVISGNIGRDPEMRASQSGTSILSFSVAVNERTKRGDEWTDYTNWIDVVVFGRRADSLSKILAKGMKVAVSGHLHYSSWEDKTGGGKRSKLELVADDVDLMQRKDAQSQQGGSYGQQQQQYGNYSQQQQYAPQNGYQQPAGGYQQQYQQAEMYPTGQPF